jgi:hypothetical protein
MEETLHTLLSIFCFLPFMLEYFLYGEDGKKYVPPKSY